MRIRDVVLALVSIAVAIGAVVLALRQDGEPPDAVVATPVTRIGTPDPGPSIPTTSPTRTPPATATPRPVPAPSPSPTPTPPAPGVNTLSPPAVRPSPTPDPDRTPEPPVPYSRIDATGEASTPGSYALLMPAGDGVRVVTTYEELRTETTAARFNVVDADGVSRAARFDAIAVGDLFEWRQAENCWTRFEVTSASALGDLVREFGIRWMTYAFTGCSGAIAADAAATVDFGPLPDLGNPSLAYPIRHGPWQLVPEDWGGSIEAVERGHPPWRYDRSPVPITTLFGARQLPYWRDPVFPLGWMFQFAERESASPFWYGYQATYGTMTGQSAFTISASVAFLSGDLTPMECAAVCYETRVIAGRPARISYSPPDPYVASTSLATVWIYDAELEAEYVVRETEHRLFGGRIGDALAVARSLFEPQPERPGVVRYGRLDTSGTVDEPGSYVFTSDSSATAAAVTTFEGLRDGSATALLVHTADVDGASHGTLFDSVEAGDRFEWRRAADCWVRYRVTDVLPNPADSAPHKLFGVEWETYAFTGCFGELPTNAYATFDFNALPDLGGPSLAVPVVQGPWQLVPEGWDGVIGIRTSNQGSPGQSHDEARVGSGDLAAARAGPNWLEPTLPSGWTFEGAFSGPLTGTTSGYCASWNDTSGRRAVEICGAYGTSEYAALDASWDDGTGVREFRYMSDRPALVVYSPRGPDHDEDFRVEVSIYDASPGTAYTVFGYHPTLVGGNVEAVIKIAHSLFAPPNPR